MGIILEMNNGIDGSVERNNKQKEYIDYINEHIDNVKKAYDLFFVPLLDKENISTLFSDEMFKNAIRNVLDNVEEHDNSKFSDEEFEPYRLKYHATEYEKSLDDSYQKWVNEVSEDAWIHHYTNNAHHPLYWLNKETGVIEDMSLEAIIEMICDWEAMSMKFKTDTIEWYNKADKEKSQMSDKTKQIVEEILFNITH